MTNDRFKNLIGAQNRVDWANVQESTKRGLREQLSHLAHGSLFAPGEDREPRVGDETLEAFNQSLLDDRDNTDAGRVSARSDAALAVVATMQFGRLAIEVQWDGGSPGTLAVVGTPTVKRIEDSAGEERTYEIDVDELLLRAPDAGEGIAIEFLDGSRLLVESTDSAFWVASSHPRLRLPTWQCPPLEDWRQWLGDDQWLATRLDSDWDGAAAELEQIERAGDVLRYAATLPQPGTDDDPYRWVASQSEDQVERVSSAVCALAHALRLEMLDPDSFTDAIHVLGVCEQRESLESLRVMIPRESSHRVLAEEALAAVDALGLACVLAEEPLSAWDSEERWRRSRSTQWMAWWNGAARDTALLIGDE